MEPMTPRAAPILMMLRPTRVSYPAASSTGISTGKKGRVSSSMPKAAPAMLNTSISTGISSRSRPLSLRMMAPMPASMAPVFITTARKPPMTRV